MQELQKISDKTLGRWTKEQHYRFLEGLRIYGKNWKKIEEFIATRNGSQIRSHAQKFFLKVCKGNINDNEVEEVSLGSPELQQFQETQTVISKSIAEGEKLKCDYSYFMMKILEHPHSTETFNFWQTLIDQRENTTENSNLKNKRHSFVSFEQENVQEHIGKPHKKAKL